ncbi:unnamed protein product [Rotaria sordida]|uniref:Uncharacterized protein n=1 Tax=Rotaria sordida TaxID=392033 RepID=A0A814K9D9_9BILA|nr:unnamed protein product [Rotaria sordida]CAF1406920.1 unnamed protein product [Rotaria sordida]
MSRNALVTGAAQGIGRAIALRLARDGLNVAVNDIKANSSGLNKVQQEIEKMGRKSVAITADVSIDKEVETMMKNAAKQLGSLDVAIANAGIVQVKSIVDITTEDWDKIFATNARGVFLCYKEAAKVMIAQGTGGKIIGACSMAGHTSAPMASHYCASKWAVRGLTQAAAMELAKHKITVNAYCPGIVETSMYHISSEEMAKIEGKQKEDIIKQYLSMGHHQVT